MQLFSRTCIFYCSVLRILFALQFGNNSLQLSLRFTLWKVAHIVVLRCNLHQPGKKSQRGMVKIQTWFFFKYFALEAHTLTTLVWCLCKCGCSSWSWGQTRCRAPTLACGPGQWTGAAEPPGYLWLWGNGLCVPNGPPAEETEEV